jgi:hypothetical protein
MTLAEMSDEFARLSRLLDQGLQAMRDQAHELADAENEYRKQRSLAWPTTTGTAKEREDAVNALTADARKRRDLADYMRTAALEAVRSRRTQISSLQTLLNAHQAEAQFARTGPAAA